MAEPRQVAELAAQAAEEKKGIDVVILDVHALTLVADYFVIVSGNTPIQVRAIVEHIQEILKKEGIFPLRREGLRDDRWVVLDYGGTVVHVLLESVRDYYDLEGLWYEAPRVKPVRRL